ncbi:MAG: hypothetical protein U0Q21_11575 [Dermatophilaceae bacterium]
MTALALILVLAGMAFFALLALVPLLLEHDAERTEAAEVTPTPPHLPPAPLPTRARLA